MTHLELIFKKAIPQKYRSWAQQVHSVFKSLWYFGYKFSCPLCGGHFRKFLSAGVKPRLNARCPRCGSLERHRLLYLYLKNKTNFFKDNLDVLDVAPLASFQKMSKKLSNLNYNSVDISSSIAMTKMDITDISLPDDQFDCIICYHVLEHIVDDEKAMKELFRVLKPHGWAILQSPVDFSRDKTFEDLNITSFKERERFFEQKDHVRIYGRDYKDKLEKAGFVVKLDNYINELKPDIFQKYGLMKDEIIYFCIKPDYEK